MNQIKKVRNNSLVVQGSILIIASFLVRLIGMGYRIPLQWIIKDNGISYYQAAFSIYSIIIIISGYGIPIAVSKLISAKLTLREYKNAHRVFIGSLFFAVISGSIGMSILWFGAPFFANLYNLPNSLYAIRALAPTIFIVSILGVFRGYFQGMNTMVPTALSQIIEQIANAAVSIIAAKSLIDMGVYYGATGGTIGTGTGALVGLVFVIFVYFLAKPMIHKRIQRDTHTNVLPYKKILKIILITVTPIVLGQTVFHITNYIDDVMFNQGLRFNGYGLKEIEKIFGMLSGKYRIIILLPISMGSAIAAATVPSIAKSLNLGKKEEVNRKIDVSIRFLMLLAIPAFVGILVLAAPVLQLLFMVKPSSIVVNNLKLGSISIVFFCLSTIGIGILQGLDRIKLPVYHTLIALSLKVILNIFLLFVFDTNMYGIIITNIIFSFTSAYLNMKSIKKITHFKFNRRKTFILPLASAILMGIITYGSYNITYYLISSNPFSTLFSVLLAIIVYGIFIVKFKVLEKDELLTMPKGKKIVDLLYKFRLLN
ncbi:MAG: polysaccharide biosynthesis C-terminal domain-containing protein [Eubacteriales bacterium]